MKNSLLIVAHPKVDSFSFAMANKYKKLALKDNCQVQIIDLYRDKHQQSFFSFENANERRNTVEMDYYQEKIKWADELVFIFPYWWGSYPAILKNFMDWNFSHGFAFKYVNSRPVGLLKEKTVKIYTSTGAPHFYYMITGAHRRLKCMIKKQIVEFCGMKLTSFTVFGGVDTKGRNTQKNLDSIKL